MSQHSETVKIPLTVLTQPRDGSTVMLDYWWVVDGDYALAFRPAGNSTLIPQSNKSELVTKNRISGSLRAEFIPVAYCGSW